MTRLEMAARQALEALRDLAYHPAFEDDAPQFNMGGIGYEAIEALEKALENE